MKTIILQICLVLFAGTLFAQETKNIVLNPPAKSGGLSVMEALWRRASVRDFDTTAVRLQDLSDLLWAANGINRPEEGKRTAASALNAQDIDVYVFMKQGVYLYDAKKHVLNFIASGDHRNLIAGGQVFVTKAPLICLLVSDISRFKAGDDSSRLVWAAIDAGIVSQNIALFCASKGLVARPRASMEQQKLKELLKLKDSQHLLLNNPVSYRKK